MRPKYFSIWGLMLSALVVCCFPRAASALDLDRFRTANEQYRNAEYGKAAQSYESLASGGSGPAEVYFNLGNAYFKKGDLGEAILNYKRAERLRPRDRDIRTNLDYATRHIEYKIKDARNWYQKKLSQLLSYVRVEELALLALFAYLVFMTRLIFRVLTRRAPVFGQGGWAAFSLAVLLALPLVLKQADVNSQNVAVITDASAEVRYGPSTVDQVAFRLAEGLTVSLKDEKDDWYRIELADGRTGWIRAVQVTAV